jgi:hypothetical protein
MKLAGLDSRHNRTRMHPEEDTVQRPLLLRVGRAAIEGALTMEEASYNELVRSSG